VEYSHNTTPPKMRLAYALETLSCNNVGGIWATAGWNPPLQAEDFRKLRQPHFNQKKKGNIFGEIIRFAAVWPIQIPELWIYLLSKAEAREHIAQIRRAKRLDGPESNTSDLEADLSCELIAINLL
jgi:hypothetical protein